MRCFVLSLCLMSASASVNVDSLVRAKSNFARRAQQGFAADHVQGFVKHVGELGHLAQLRKATTELNGENLPAAAASERRMQDLLGCALACPTFPQFAMVMAQLTSIGAAQAASGAQMNATQYISFMCPYQATLDCMEQNPAVCMPGGASVTADDAQVVSMSGMMKCFCGCNGMTELMTAGNEPTVQNMCAAVSKVLPCVDEGGVCEEWGADFIGDQEGLMLMCDAEREGCHDFLFELDKKAECLAANAETQFSTCSSKMHDFSASSNETMAQYLEAHGVAVNECCNSASSMLECANTKCMAYAIAIAESHTNAMLQEEAQTAHDAGNEFHSNLTQQWNDVCPDVNLPTAKTVGQLEEDAAEAVRRGALIDRASETVGAAYSGKSLMLSTLLLPVFGFLMA